MKFVSDLSHVEIAKIKNAFFMINKELLMTDDSIEELEKIFNEEILYSKANDSIHQLRYLILEYTDENNSYDTMLDDLKNIQKEL